LPNFWQKRRGGTFSKIFLSKIPLQKHFLQRFAPDLEGGTFIPLVISPHMFVGWFFKKQKITFVCPAFTTFLYGFIGELFILSKTP